MFAQQDAACGRCDFALCLLVTTVRCAKTVEPMEMPFGGLTSGGTKEPYIK